MSNGLFIGDKDPVEIRVGSRKATSVYYSGDNVPQNPVLHLSAKGLTTEGIAQSGGVTDLSGNGNNGTAYGGVEVVNDSEMGECFRFDGSNDYIVENNFLQNNHSFSVFIPFIIKGNTGINERIINVFSLASSYRGFCFYIRQNLEDVRLQWYNGTFNQEIIIDNFVPQLNVLYKLVISYDYSNNLVTVYINDLKHEQSINGGIVFNSNEKIRIGYGYLSMLGGNGHFFNGLISEVKIFPYALTSEQVQALYRGIKKVWSNVPDGAILHLNAKGLTTEGIKQTDGIPDLSGNGKHAQAFGGVSIVNDNEVGECFSFDGVNGYIDLNKNRPYGTDITELTVVCKVLSREYKSGTGVFSEYTENNGKLLCHFFNGNTNMYQFYVAYGLQNNVRTNTPKITYPLNEWSHNVYVYKSSQSSQFIKEYKNGTLINELTSGLPSKIINYPTNELWIGRYNKDRGTNFYFNGLISDIYIYPHALTAHEVKKLYLASRR